MTLISISEPSVINQLKPINLIATDIDGTLTQQGLFTSKFLLTLENLQKNKIKVVLITGRSAGWCQGIVNYLPVWGIIAENGGIYCLKKTQTIEKLTPLTNLTEHRQGLKESFEYLQTQFPQLQSSSDNLFRLTDWTFDCHNLSQDDLLDIEKVCNDHNWGFTYSHIQGHLKPQEQNKANGLMMLKKSYFPNLPQNQIVTVGDSPNDESLFNQDLFPVSVGVANILNYQERLQHKPVYVTHSTQIDGFCELVQLLIGE